jgi:hypothetical protein
MKSKNAVHQTENTIVARRYLAKAPRFSATSQRGGCRLLKKLCWLASDLDF